MLWIIGGIAAFVLLISTTVGIHSQPWSPWWFAGKDVAAIQLDAPAVASTDPGVLPDIAHIAGAVTDAERYALARAAGFSPEDAITATAISIAEDGSGNPAALSGMNWNHTRDLGLWQINSSHWPAYGGQSALEIPINNARAAFAIFGPGRNWCAWSTYERRCGVGYTGAYAAFLGRASVAAQGGR